MIVRPYLSVKKPPIRAPTAAPKAFAPIAPRIEVHIEPKPNAAAHAVSATEDATMQPESRKFVRDTAMVPLRSCESAIVLTFLNMPTASHFY